MENVEVELPGASSPEEMLVVGAHHDSARGSPGANDNGSGLAALLALAGLLQGGALPRPARTVRFVAFATEEPPFTRAPEMGSFAYARRRRARREDHHRPSDLPERVDFSTLAAVTTGLASVVRELATGRAA